MRLGSIDNVTVTSLGQATRRMVDLSLILDVSSSIGFAVADGERRRANLHRLVRSGSRSPLAVDVQQRAPPLLIRCQPVAVSTRRKSRPTYRKICPGEHSHGRGALSWMGRAEVQCERHAVEPADHRTVHGRRLQRVPGNYPAAPGVATSLRSYDFPQNANDPDGQTWNNPQIVGLFDTQSGNQSPSFNLAVPGTRHDALRKRRSCR